MKRSAWRLEARHWYATAISYGWSGNLFLLHEWYRTVTETTRPNLLASENISFASMWAKWLAPGAAASALAVLSAVVAVAAGLAAIARRRSVKEPNYLEGAYFLVLLDICGGLPFLMAVKPSQRTEMSAVYSSFRDVSGILSPGLAWLVLQFSPVPGVFAAGAVALLAAWWVAGYLHPELGVPGSQRVRQRPG